MISTRKTTSINIKEIYTFLICLQLTMMSFAQQSSISSIYDVPLVDLINVKHISSGDLTSLSEFETVAPSTLISENQINNSTARNIYDLIEMDVPGAIWTSHKKVPSLGIRGLISNRNLGFGMLINSQRLRYKQQRT